MILKRLIAMLIGALVCTGLAPAQDQKPADTKEPTAKQEKAAKGSEKKSEMAGMPMPKPSPEMEKLAKMIVGTWATNEKFEVSDMMPKGGTGKGTAHIRKGPGGLSIVEDYRSRNAGGAFAGHGVFWWDDKAQGYKTVWCDNTTAGCQVSNGLGKWEGANLVFTDEQEMMGKKMAMKEVLAASGENSFSLTMDSGMDGAELKRFMTIKYTKGASAASTAAKTPQ